MSAIEGHSRPKTLSRHRGPIRLTVSIEAAVAKGGFQSSSRVIMIAMGLIATKASNPPMTLLQPESLPARPSGLASDSWNRSSRTTGPRMSSISLSGSNRRAMSCKNGSMSVGPRDVGEDVGVESKGPDSAESSSRGVTSSIGPI